VIRSAFQVDEHTAQLKLVTAAVANASAPAFEHVALANADDQAAARARYHVAVGEFAVVLVNPDGSERVHSTTPIDIHAVVASLDSAETMGPLTASLY
jgi:hypothetical protein